MSSLNRSSTFQRNGTEAPEAATGRQQHWRTLEEFAATPEFRERIANEFPHGVAPDDFRTNAVSRRRWLQLMGASLALAGVAGCRWETEEIAPFVHRPLGRIPGKPERYATVMQLGRRVQGLLATCYDGRPIKLEGNPEHAVNEGATDLFAQAAVLELYDPDRSRDVVLRADGRPSVSSWQAFDAAWTKTLSASQGAGGNVAVLSGVITSPTLARLKTLFKDVFPKALWVEYEPLESAEPRRGIADAVGTPGRAVLEIPQTAVSPVILSIDCDFLIEGPDALAVARAYAANRSDPKKAGRLYVVESRLTNTGAAADHRLALPVSKMTTFVQLLEHVVTGGEATLPSSPDSTEARYLREFLAALRDDADRLVVVAGNHLPAEIHAAVARINGHLEKHSSVPPLERARVLYVEEPAAPDGAEALAELVDAMQAGKIEHLLILGGNPAYDAPADLKFADSLEKVSFTAHLSLYDNETSRQCTWHLPESHFLESWSDALDSTGTYVIGQPTIAPLYETRSAIELLAQGLAQLNVLSSEEKDPRTLVRRTFGELIGDASDDRWLELLNKGTAWSEDRRPKSISLSDVAASPSGSPAKLFADLLAKSQAYELLFTGDSRLYDGRFANNGWLQELPDPMTRLTWGNAIVIGPATADSLGVQDGDVVRVGEGERSIEGPVCVLPGVARNTLVVPLGHGRTAAGHVGGDTAENVPPVGFNAYTLRTRQAPWHLTKVTVEKLGTRVQLSSVQDHYLIDPVGRSGQEQRLGQLVRETTVAALQDKEHPYRAEDAVHHPPLISLWQEHEYTGHRWGMSVDLTSCIGCGACVVACQAENNIPVVGPERVQQGREMHWLRIDRYFRGSPETPQVVHQPVMCHHCEMAPCEQVCPVAATVHSSEGLNDMVYNRCVGTRYCANNCPYKVRRFNYFYYHKDLDAPGGEVKKMAFNPEVTVRSRGVMEKCTYCVHRIQAAKIEHKNRGETHIPDGTIQTACQQVCPTKAIRFGDLGDPESEVARRYYDPRSYGMLAELNVKPRTRYLARVRNPHPRLEALENEHTDHDEHDQHG
ncbi:MAG: 4Fe-4S dicluster domain-containing protein [Planctomycetota bacterium]|nr:MAG: 4Fe-4S dicluster domain-containing protein [Planctomycetota bacterium]